MQKLPRTCCLQLSCQAYLSPGRVPSKYSGGSAPGYLQLRRRILGPATLVCHLSMAYLLNSSRLLVYQVLPSSQSRSGCTTEACELQLKAEVGFLWRKGFAGESFLTWSSFQFGFPCITGAELSVNIKQLHSHFSHQPVLSSSFRLSDGRDMGFFASWYLKEALILFAASNEAKKRNQYLRCNYNVSLGPRRFRSRRSGLEGLLCHQRRCTARHRRPVEGLQVHLDSHLLNEEVMGTSHSMAYRI